MENCKKMWICWYESKILSCTFRWRSSGALLIFYTFFDLLNPLWSMLMLFIWFSFHILTHNLFHCLITNKHFIVSNHLQKNKNRIKISPLATNSFDGDTSTQRLALVVVNIKIIFICYGISSMCSIVFHCFPSLISSVFVVGT